MPTAIVTHNSGSAADLGHLGTWLADRGFDVRPVNRDQTRIAAEIADDADLLVMVGSTWSVARPMDRPEDDPHAAGAIAAELALVRRRVDQDRPVLGICFGGQLLCRAMGGEVRTLDRRFADWATPRASIPELFREWFFLHEDHCLVPGDVQVVAEADHATVAFRRGRAWGLQCHPEVTAGMITTWLSGLGMARTDIERSVQPAIAHGDAKRAQAHALFDALWSRMAGGPAASVSV